MLLSKKKKLKKIAFYTVISLLIAIVVGLAVKFGIDIYKELTKPVRTLTEQEIPLGGGLNIIKTGKYSGKYMEDGTDDEVENVMFIILKNNSSRDLQYADVTVFSADTEFLFTASNVPSGSSVMLLEKGRQESKKKITSAESRNVVFFDKNMDIQKSLFKIQQLEGAINLINISKKDITEDIYLYYKKKSEDVYFGGITYLAKVTGGMKADEIKQLSTKHFSSADSEIVNIVLVTAAESE